MIELNADDSYSIAKIFQEKSFTYLASQFRNLGDSLKVNNSTIPLIKTEVFFDKTVLENSFFQDKIFNYFGSTDYRVELNKKQN